MWEIYSCVKKKWYSRCFFSEFAAMEKAKNLSKQHGGRIELNFIVDDVRQGYIVYYRGKCIKKYTEEEEF